MKYLKPILFLIAGFAIALLVSFKNDEPKVETVTIFTSASSSTVVYPTGIQKEYKYKGADQPLELNKIINNLNTEGYKMVGSCSTDNLYYSTIYLERTKQ